MSNPFVNLGVDDFRLGVSGIMPRGYAWTVSPDTVQGKIWAGIAASAQSLHARAGDLSERESDPGRAIELLRDWERAYGLPDPCTPLNPTVQQRQAALRARISAQGGQSIGYYIDFAATLGYPITIEEFRPFRFGSSRFGDALMLPAAVFFWRVHPESMAARRFRFGVSGFGEPFREIDNTELECRIRAIAPAHTVVLFHYA